MNGDGQTSALEAVVLGGKFEAGLAFLAGTGDGPLWICTLPRSGGRKHEQAKPLRGFGSAGVLEIVEDWDRSTYRAVYTVLFRGVVFVLHVFQKKSKRGAATPKADIDLIRERLKVAEQMAKELSR
jgi:hypothetical protein